MHLLDAIRGRPSNEWMEAGRWTTCRLCGKLASRTHGNGVHRRCLAEQVSQASQRPASSVAMGSRPSLDVRSEIPSIAEICKAQVSIREFLEPALLARAEKEYLHCMSSVITSNTPDAWSYPDSEAKQRCRLAWIELCMFTKVCLPQLPGGKAKRNRNYNLTLTRLERWVAGVRRSLWDDMPHRSTKERTGEKSSSTEKAKAKRHEIAIAFTEHGMPARAIDRLVSLGMSPDTPAVEAIMRSKFIEPPSGQGTSHRPAAPPANELTESAIAKAINSFKWGAGAGPLGTRPDFLRQVIGKKGMKSGISIVAAFCNLLADGRAPPELRPFFGGANGHAFRKESKPGAEQTDDEDARPVCCGEVWRRVVGKALLATETEALQVHLCPHQLAVNVRSGAEVLPHLARQWMQDFCEDGDRVLVDFDEANAHNTVDRHTFLLRAREIIPGLCRWLEFIYPTNCPTLVFYRGRTIESTAAGQQGCPLMGTCHALVQRILLESLGAVPVDQATTQLAPILDPPAQLDMTPLFADDGALAGPSQEVLRSIHHLHAIMPSLGLKFSKLDVVPAAGELHQIDIQAFIDAGCRVNTSRNFEVMKSPIGDTTHCEGVAYTRVQKAIKVIGAIAELPDAHCALHLLRHQAGRMNYLARTTPGDHIGKARGTFDSAVRAGYETIIGRPMPDQAWQQAVLPTRQGGLGLSSARSNADVAYCASRAAMRDKWREIYPASMGWGDTLSVEDPLQRAVDRLNARLPPEDAYALPAGDEECAPVRQQLITHSLAKVEAASLRDRSGQLDKARLQAYAAPGASRWIGATPSKTLDKHLTNSQLSTTTAMQLGVDVFEEAFLCRICGMCADTKGIHCLSCTGGGDIVLRHNDVRDIVYSFAGRARLQPQLEKAGLLAEPGIFLELRRPADVLVEGLPSHGRNSASAKVALDIKVVNAIGADHSSDTCQGPLVAAEAYREKALATNQTADRCRAQGITYEPLVFTCQGGCERHAEGILTQIAEAVARAEDLEAASVKADILEQISSCLARHVARAISRRVPRRPGLTFNAIQRAMRDATDIDEDMLEVEPGAIYGSPAARDIRL